MDPNANLTEQLRLARRIMAQWDRSDDETADCESIATNAARLAYLVVSLDEWRTKGGFLPQRWEGK